MFVMNECSLRSPQDRQREVKTRRPPRLKVYIMLPPSARASVWHFWNKSTDLLSQKYQPYAWMGKKPHRGGFLFAVLLAPFVAVAATKAGRSELRRDKKVLVVSETPAYRQAGIHLRRRGDASLVLFPSTAELCVSGEVSVSLFTFRTTAEVSILANHKRSVQKNKRVKREFLNPEM